MLKNKEGRSGRIVLYNLLFYILINNEYDEVPNETDNVIPTEEVKIVRKNVSDGEFDRNFSVPPGSKLLSGPNPVVTNNTNERLSNARTNFWSNILK